MHRFLLWAVFSSMACAQVSSAPDPTITGSAREQRPAQADTALSAMPNLPPPPSGKSTVIGGTLLKVDPVRDQVTVHVFGGGSMKIFFDARTQVYRDGQRVSLHDLKNGDRASVETILDGTMVFARSVHILTRRMEAECHGQVLAYNAAAGELRVRDFLSSEPLALRVPSGTTILREDHEASSAQLRAGALVDVEYQASGSGQGVATKIAILAIPGLEYIFSGRVAFVDVRAGKMAIVDPHDQRSYDISFNPRSSVLGDVREGNDVVVTAVFDGTRYSANAIKLNRSPIP